MAERKKMQFISSEPRVALRLREWRPVILPRDIYDWSVDWVEDIGRIMRSRSYIAGTAASYVAYGVMLLLFGMVPAIKSFPFVARVLGAK